MSLTNISKKALYVPAWWPCSFFEEQISALSENFLPFLLYGNCKEMSLRRYVKCFFRVKSLKSKFIGTEAAVDVVWVKYKSPKKLLRQTESVSDYVGMVILKLTGGERPNVIMLQSVSSLSVFVERWAAKNGIPVLLTEHLIYIRRKFDYLSRLKESVYSKVSQVLCVSNYQYRNLLTTGLEMKKVSIVGNMINDGYVPDDVSSVRKNGRIMFVASHLSDKDFEVLISVADKLKNSGIGIDIYGLTGKEYLQGGQPAISKVQASGVNGILCFMGNVSHDQLLKTYSCYSLLVSTSRSETFGLSVAEAIAYGTPVVCTDSGGVRDFVNERNGRVVDIRDADAFAGVIVSSVFKREELAVESANIIARYGTKAYKSKLLTIVSSVCYD